MSWTQIETQEHPNGEFVLWNDYARLKAHNDDLGSCLGDAHAHNAREEHEIWKRIEGLKAEVERLTKKLAVADAEVFLLKSDLRAAKEAKASV